MAKKTTAKKATTKKKTSAAKTKTAKAKTAKGPSLNLVIVESPAKSKTINKILGKDFKVMASMGHIVDLPTNRMAIDFENGFTPEYVPIKGRKKYITDLKKEAKNAKAVYLAADPDREGEAICWHLKNFIAKDKEEVFRVSFEEITEKAVRGAFEKPRQLDMNKVNAQQARRIMDRIVGYSLSPLLWKKITRGLSAGRVQSVAVKLVVEREEAIRKFKPEEYWHIDAILKKKGSGATKLEDFEAFKAKLVKYRGEKIQISDQETSTKMIAELRDAEYVIKDVTKKDRKSHPRSPFTTSVLQQDAFNKIGFSSSRTMRVAQRLYEGVELGEEGGVGLITYMRTDSVRVSEDALKDVREYITKEFGEKYCPDSPQKYKSKKRAQEAHEAIRPTLPLRSPEDVRKFLSDEEFKLYDLIWKKFVSSQMESALYSVLTVHIDAGDYHLRAGGSVLLFDGFLKLYRADDGKDDTMIEIPPLDKGEVVDLIDLETEQHFTKPPPRFSDATLVKTLEEQGIGRPSTYAPIIRTVVSRNYIKRVDKYFHPTELGELVNELLVTNFPDIVDAEFTARMEDALDFVEDGKEDWVKVLQDFYVPFLKNLEEAKEKMKSVKRHEEKTDEVCEECGRPMVIKWGRRGRFLSCSGFPACKNAKSITTGIKCPSEECDGELVERKSARGSFYGCTKYPKCTYTTKRLPSESGEEPEESKE